MQTQPQISFQGISHSDAIEQAIRDRIDELEKFHSGIIACRVVVDSPHRTRNKGKIYEIRIDVSVPGKDVVISREAGFDHAHEDIYVAIRDSFDAARRGLEDQVRKMSGHRTKRHPATSHGHVVRIFDEDGYGFIETVDGHEVFFARDSVNGQAWSRMDIGSKVRFKEMDGDKGPYGSQVTLLD